ncbi:LacI family DNA-binding transcriptional regulator [Variovorax sp. 278MFTsu5.1]|uniref:LacI family DNA-binding transcriptional regulator n=1 Tax=Variovorax sp. 278MFTsu5.1 TaxID=3158366 RepID=UPI003AAF5636
MNAGKQKIDLRDVARLAGVSLGSASRAMNGAGASAATQEKVNQAAAALGYRPNHAARVLRSRLSRTIGCLLPDISNPLYAQVFRALEDEFLRHDYLLLLANGANDVDRETKALGTFTQRGMDGVILAPGNERNAALVEALRVLPMPAVVFDREVSGAHDAVLIDHAGGVRRVVEHLLGLGHRDIALVLWQGDTRPVRRRVQGFRTAFQAAGLPAPDLLVQARSVTASVKAEVTELLARPDRPTALIVQGTHMLNSALRAVAARGLQVPRDISVVAIGDTPFAAEHDPAVSVLDIDQAETARCLVDLLLTRIADNGLPQRKARVGLRYVERDSVAAPPRYS